MGMATGFGFTDQSPKSPGKLMGMSVLAYSYIAVNTSLTGRYAPGQMVERAACSAVTFSRRKASTSALVIVSKISGKR